MADYVIDTTVLQKANALIQHPSKEGREFARRIKLLEGISSGHIRVVVSESLMEEYRRQVSVPRNDFVRAFFTMIDNPEARVHNWKKRWSGGDREKARKCRFPHEDAHVLRTAIRDQTTTIYAEEVRMVVANSCIYRAFRVHIVNPVSG